MSLVDRPANRPTRWLYIACIIGLAACTSQNRRPDLTGSVTCGTLTCGDGQLCHWTERDGSMGSANPIDDYACIAPPAVCDMYQCSYSCADPHSGTCCPACIADLCGGYIPSYDGERTVFCQGF